jgi:hypothetical protein
MRYEYLSREALNRIVYASPIPYTLSPIPYTLYPIPYTLYLIPYTLYLYPTPHLMQSRCIRLIPLKFHSFALTKIFLLPLQIKMDKTSSRLRKALKISGIAMLIGVSVISCVQAGMTRDRSRSSITCDGDSSDTINLMQDRHRTRVFFEILKKVTLMTTSIQNACANFEIFNSFELKSLFMNVYQRNVFYVYTFSTVP